MAARLNVGMTILMNGCPVSSLRVDRFLRPDVVADSPVLARSWAIIELLAVFFKRIAGAKTH